MRRNAGLSLVELVLVGALLAFVATKMVVLFRATNEIRAEKSSSIVVENQARTVLDRIAYAVMGTSKEKLVPDPESPAHSSEVTYELNLGMESGEVVWGDPEFIGLSEDGSALEWVQNPGEADEQRIVWTNLVRPFLEGELPNGVDDNGNGLIDESGLSFELQGERVTIRLTLEQVNESGRIASETVETVVNFRNRMSTEE